MIKEKKFNPYKVNLTLVSVFGLIYFFQRYEILLYTSLSIGLISLISSVANEFIAKSWMKLGWIMSLIVPKIVLSLFYFIILTPIALTSKFFGNKKYLKLKDNSQSLFEDVNKEFQPNSFEKMW
jgi:hypothetical protein